MFQISKQIGRALFVFATASLLGAVGGAVIAAVLFIIYMILASPWVIYFEGLDNVFSFSFGFLETFVTAGAILGGIVGVIFGLIFAAWDWGFGGNQGRAIQVIKEALRTGVPRVYAQRIGKAIQNLYATRDPVEIKAMREAILVWNPLYDRVVQLFAETVQGDLPSLNATPGGKPLRNEHGNYLVKGGWPCQRYPEGWHKRVREVLEDYQRLRSRNQLCGKPERKTGAFARLRDYLRVCLDDPSNLSGADVGMIRLLLASIASKRGLPGSSRNQALRKMREGEAAHSTHRELSRVLIVRLQKLPRNDSFDSTEAMLGAIQPTCPSALVSPLISLELSYEIISGVPDVKVARAVEGQPMGSRKDSRSKLGEIFSCGADDLYA